MDLSPTGAGFWPNGVPAIAALLGVVRPALPGGVRRGVWKRSMEGSPVPRAEAASMGRSGGRESDRELWCTTGRE